MFFFLDRTSKCIKRKDSNEKEKGLFFQKMCTFLLLYKNTISLERGIKLSFSFEKRVRERMGRIIVTTCATHDCGYMNSLRDSCLKYKYEFHLFGFGMEWKGFMWGIQIILDGLSSLSLKEDDLVLIVDGFDCLLCMNSCTLQRVYLEVCDDEKKDVLLIGKEHPREESSFLHRLTVRKLSKHMYEGGFGNEHDTLNTGSILGSWKILSFFLPSLIHFSKKNNLDDDQVCVNKYFLEEKNLVDVPLKVDEKGLFFCYCERRMIQLFLYFLWNRNKLKNTSESIIVTKEGGVKRVKNNAQVAVLHGIWNTDMDWVCKKMNLIYNRKCSYLKPYSQYSLRVISDTFVRSMYALSLGSILLLGWNISRKIMA